MASIQLNVNLCTLHDLQKSLIDSSSKEGIGTGDFVGDITLTDVNFKYPARADVQVHSTTELVLVLGEKLRKIVTCYTFYH